MPGNVRKKVVIVDDSALMRQLLTAIIDQSPELKVVGAAPNPKVARELIKKENPDVVTLDIEMPGMDGLSFLEKIMRLRPMPVVMISSLTLDGASATITALELGAVDFVAKPASDLKAGLLAKADEIVAKVTAAANVRVDRLERSRTQSTLARINFDTTEQLIAIGASTGGVGAIGKILAEMPANAPAIVVTQHMPDKFTASFAARLDQQVAMTVKEASDRERIVPGHVYIAPGDRHLEVVRSGANYVCKLGAGAPVSGHRPSVDVLFRSVAESVRKRAIGVILTGMGKDGAEGLMLIKEAGGYTIGQDQGSAVVYGMCKVAYELGATCEQAGLDSIAARILAQSEKMAKQIG